MKITAQEFKSSPRKSITLIGMSGAGKTHISSKLEEWGWSNYSCDYEIGMKYLQNELPNIESFNGNDISSLSDYLGKLGNPDKGGFLLEKFKIRQKAYYDAEISALENMVIPENGHFIHDSTGSLCEVEDENLMQKLGEQTLFIYLKTGDKEEKQLLKRARNHPKPLFFPPSFLSEKTEQFLLEFEVQGIKNINPNDFARWVFPILFEARKPKYQRLADLYGITIPSSEFKSLKSSEEFIEIIERYLDV